MKRSFILLPTALATLAATMFAVLPNAHAATNLVADATLRTCLTSTMATLGVTPEQAGAVTQQDFNNMYATGNFTNLTCRGVASLQGLQNMKMNTLAGWDAYVPSLDFGTGTISDLSPLSGSGLANVATLYLYKNNVTSLAPLSNLKNLHTLIAWTNQITDVSPLAGLTNLTELQLGYNSITSVAALKNLTNLQTLWMQYNKITDVSPLAGLTKLTSLDLSYNTINNVSYLKNMTQLTYLLLFFNQIADVSMLSSIPGLSKAASVNYAGLSAMGQAFSLSAAPGATIALPKVAALSWDNPVTWTSPYAAVTVNSSAGTVTLPSTFGQSPSSPITLRFDSASTTFGGTVTVTAILQPVTGISVSPAQATISVGGTVSLSAAVSPSNASNKSVTWSSNSASVATVSSTGVVTGNAPGTATITAKAADGSGKSATSTVTVKPILVSSVSITATSTSVTVGGTMTLTASVLPSNAANKSVTWSSSNTSVATVSSTGMVTGKAPGTATITAKAADGSGKSATVTIMVPAPFVFVTGISIAPSSVAVAVGGTATLIATITPSTATNKLVTWSSSNTNVATVSSAGVVYGVAAGTATITVRAADGSGKTTAVSVTVLQPCTQFSDVASDNLFAPQICWMWVNKITTGMTATTYAPQGNVTREAMAAFLYRLAGSPTYAPPAKPTFSDVSNDKNSKDFNAFYKEIEWMNAAGITHGMGDGTYAPKQPVTREAMAAFLYRMAGSPTYTPPSKPSFPDVSNDMNLTSYSQFYKEVEWMSAKGITTGMQDGTYAPKGDVTREAMAAFMWRMSNQKLYCSKYTKGIGCPA